MAEADLTLPNQARDTTDLFWEIPSSSFPGGVPSAAPLGEIPFVAPLEEVPLASRDKGKKVQKPYKSRKRKYGPEPLVFDILPKYLDFEANKKSWSKEATEFEDSHVNNFDSLIRENHIPIIQSE